MKRATRKVQALLIGCLLVAVCATGAFAGTLSGATGLITLGTADVLPHGSADVSARFVDGRFVGSVTYGIFRDVEVGVNNLRATGGAFGSGAGIMMKGIISRETASTPGMAIGLESNQSYFVVSKRLTPVLRAHVAALYGDMDGFGGGVAYTLSSASTSGTATTLLAEFTPAGLNFGARALVGPSVALEAALLDVSDFSFDLGNLAIGASMRLQF